MRGRRDPRVFVGPDINGGPLGALHAFNVDLRGKRATARVDRRTPLLRVHIIVLRIAEVTTRIIHHDIMVHRVVRLWEADFGVHQVVADDRIPAYRRPMGRAELNPGEETPAIWIVCQVVDDDTVLATANGDAARARDCFPLSS